MEDLRNIHSIPTPRRKTKDVGYKATKWVVFCIFVIYAITLLFPFLFMLMNSFKTTSDFNTNPFWFPKQFDGLNFIDVLMYQVEGQTVLSMIFWSILLTICGTFINVFLSACAAYVLAKYKFVGRNLIYGLAIFTMIVPIVGTLPSQVVMMETFGFNQIPFIGEFIGVLFLYSGCFGFNFILLYSAFSSISNSYAEAASLDGAGRFKTFFKVVLPMAKGPIIACSILQAITYWNDYSTPRLFMPNTMTLAVGLYKLQGGLKGDYPMVFASMLVAIIPVLIIYLCFQKRIIESTNAGGLKG